jgi:hypothetical protein
MTAADALLLAEECDRLRLQAIESENRTGQDLETFRDRALALDEQAKVASNDNVKRTLNDLANQWRGLADGAERDRSRAAWDKAESVRVVAGVASIRPTFRKGSR